jgi:hypothetical protein
MKSLVDCSDSQLCTREEDKTSPLIFMLSFVHNLNDYWFVSSSSPLKEWAVCRCCQPEDHLFLPLVELSRTFHTLPSLSFPQGCLRQLAEVWVRGSGIAPGEVSCWLVHWSLVSYPLVMTDNSSSSDEPSRPTEREYERAKKPVRREVKGDVGYEIWTN